MLNYLYRHWSKMGLAVALYATIILLCNLTDMGLLVFLVWLQFPIYLIHEFEEHAWPGHFKEFCNRNVFHVTTADIPLDDANIFWINILAVWVLFPLCAVLAQTVDIRIGLIPIYFGLFNATTHFLAFIKLRRYNPGLVVSTVLNYPIGIYALIVANQQGVLTLKLSIAAIALAFVLHLVIVVYAIRRYQQSQLTTPTPHGSV